MMFLRSLTETIPLENPENLETNIKTWYVNEKFFYNSGVLYIVEKGNSKVIISYTSTNAYTNCDITFVVY